MMQWHFPTSRPFVWEKSSCKMLVECFSTSKIISIFAVEKLVYGFWFLWGDAVLGKPHLVIQLYKDESTHCLLS